MGAHCLAALALSQEPPQVPADRAHQAKTAALLITITRSNRLPEVGEVSHRVGDVDEETAVLKYRQT